MTKEKNKVGLALGSGGIKGLVHVGVIKALVENNIKISAIAGSSIGAWVAVYYSLFQDLEKLEEYTVGKQKEKLRSFMEPTWRGGLIAGNKVEKLLQQWLEDASFSDLKIPVKVIATDLASGKEVIFDKGRLAPALRASMSVPTIFQPYKYKKQLLVDGGISNPVPDNVVRKMGVDKVIAVNLDDYKAAGKFTERDLGFTKVATRSLEILRHNLAELSIDQADIIISPKLEISGLNSWRQYFTYKIGKELVKIGEKEVNKKMDIIKTSLNA